jgi:DNA-binding response OmpR family regulator
VGHGSKPILLVDTYADRRTSIESALRDEGLPVDAVDGVVDALLRVFSRVPALILFSAALLDGDGASFVRLVRGDPRAANVPIVALLDRAPLQPIAAIDAILVAPLDTHAIRECIRGLLAPRRSRVQGARISADVWFDCEGRALRRGDRDVHLRPAEADLLEFLLLHPEIAVSRDVVLQRVWDGRAPHSRVVDTTVCRLRRALERVGCPDVVRAVRGHGYRLALAPSTRPEVNGPSTGSHDPLTGVTA